MSKDNETKKLAAVVVNNFGHILTYTVRSTIQQCEENAVELWGQDTWNHAVELGAKIVPCEIQLLD